MRGISGWWLALLLSGGALAAPAERSFLADLSDETLAALGSETGAPPGDPRPLLDRILATGASYRFDAGPFSVVADRRWFAVPPGDGPGAPSLELRRWPGDSVLAFYLLAGTAFTSGNPESRIPGARLEPDGSPVGRSARWEGTIPTQAGERPAVWIERWVAGAASRLGILLVPGDAGLGTAAFADVSQEMACVADRLILNVERDEWASGIPPGVTLTLPDPAAKFGDGDESRDAWQILEGGDFTLGLPPGIKARVLGTAPAPRPIVGQRVWLRGRLVDRAGLEVVVGDGRRSGYLAEVRPPTDAWAAGRIPPAGAPKGTLAAGFAFDDAKEWTGAASGRAERWSEEGFGGVWLVFRLVFPERGVEIALPVLEGRRSPALFWIPLTWRGPGQPPAPPPIDPAERFGIRLERLTRLEQKSRPFLEGFLTVPGLRADMPRSWEIAASLRTENGFPVSILDGSSGEVIGRLTLVPVGSPLMASPREGSGWTPSKRPSSYGAKACFVKGDGTRLYIAEEGHGFLLEPVPGAKVNRETWDRLAESVSLVPAKPVPSRKKQEGSRPASRAS